MLLRRNRLFGRGGYLRRRSERLLSLFQISISFLCNKVAVDRGSHMVLVLKLGRLDFLEFLSERRHDCEYSKARQRKCHRGQTEQ